MEKLRRKRLLRPSLRNVSAKLSCEALLRSVSAKRFCGTSLWTVSVDRSCGPPLWTSPWNASVDGDGKQALTR
jgi:hypothetical protein